MIELREQEGLNFKFLMQVDTQCYKIPRFIDKAARAGCSRVFIGMESIAPENLAAAGKVQNHVEQYRTMLQMWRDKKVVTIAGYILGFPADTPESIAARHCDDPARVADRHARVLLSHAATRLGRPPGPASARRAAGNRHEQLRPRTCHDGITRA